MSYDYTNILQIPTNKRFLGNDGNLRNPTKSRDHNLAMSHGKPLLGILVVIHL